MANVIDILVSKQAQAELDKVISSLKVTHEEIIKINQQGLKINGNTAPRNPAQLNASIKDSIALTEKLTAEEQKLLVATNRVETLKQKQIQTQIKENALIKSTIDLKNKEVRERQKNEQALAKEVQKLQASQNLYNKTQQQLNKVQNAYNNLAAKKERYNNLSAYEEGRLKTLQVLTEKYNTTLKAVDATVGKHTRNVGNYSGAFNSVSNSINQLTREMPAFANSVQTGFMAISNNLPIFFDAMQQAIAQQKELQAQGLPSKNALQLLASSFFTLGTALSVGVTLLTVFGPKLWDSISGSKAKKEALEAEKKALEDKNNAEKQAYQQQIQYASSEISRSKILLETAKNVSLSYAQRVKAVNELQSRYPAYLGNLSKEEILAGKTAEAEYRLNDALMKRAMFLAIKDKIAETTKALVDAEFDYIQLEKQATDAN